MSRLELTDVFKTARANPTILKNLIWPGLVCYWAISVYTDVSTKRFFDAKKDIYSPTQAPS